MPNIISEFFLKPIVMKQQTDKETLEKWHKDPKNWKLGVFYFNREDKRIFPPKRLSFLGWTINFANPLSVLIVGGIIALAAIAIMRLGS
jgi:uncharacterized membrane protein